MSVVLQREVNIVEMAAQAVGPLDQMDLETLIGQRQRRGHAAQAAADDDARLIDRERAAFQRRQQCAPGRSAIFTSSTAFSVAISRRGRMHPGTLVADVGHLEQIRVQTRLAQRFAEQRLVRPRRAGGHHDAVEPMLDGSCP